MTGGKSARISRPPYSWFPDFETEVRGGPFYAAVSWTLRFGDKRVKWFHEFGSEANRGLLLVGEGNYDVQIIENIIGRDRDDGTE